MIMKYNEGLNFFYHCFTQLFLLNEGFSCTKNTRAFRQHDDNLKASFSTGLLFECYV